jgi:hypothetical protein
MANDTNLSNLPGNTNFYTYKWVKSVMHYTAPKQKLGFTDEPIKYTT